MENILISKMILYDERFIYILIIVFGEFSSIVNAPVVGRDI